MLCLPAPFWPRQKNFSTKGKSERDDHDDADWVCCSLHPIRIATGFEKACKEACKYLEVIADTIHFEASNIEPLVQTASTTLGSKVINRYQRQMAEIAVKAVLSVADLDRKVYSLFILCS